jgi:hypothetical protein
VSGPREIIAALSGGSSTAAIVEHLAARGPSSADELSGTIPIGRCGARAQLVRMRAAGVAEREDCSFRLIARVRTHRYYLEPDALRHAARWLDALADRAERANRGAAIAPMPEGRSR